MKEIIWKKLNLFEKIIICLGFLNVWNPFFWILLIIFNFPGLNKHEDFFNPSSMKVVYFFGWINFIWVSIILTSILANLTISLFQNSPDVEPLPYTEEEIDLACNDYCSEFESADTYEWSIYDTGIVDCYCYDVENNIMGQGELYI
ncbi:MAG: hypothetical protein KAU90_03560 [Sulfurovaceae bacterium]|nr:hypothetical protein [Sulfurovaceae bacterium]